MIPWAMLVIAPVTVVVMFGVSIYIRVRTRKLYEEMSDRGLLIYSFPIIMPSAFFGTPNQSQQLLTPGLPPPRSYTTGESYGASSSTGLPPPPSYTSIFKTLPNVQSVPSVST